ncbi:MAG: ABC transporter permease [Alteromonadaceae bacterium]|nr:ABC transporter permease [Alteromonadaceae bacterium]MBL4908721.1 ABC transporter permease [Alteromonadaceae bacterium]
MKAAFALIWINFKSFPQRLTSSLISILSIACVAAVILGVLTLTQGMVKTMQRSGLDNTLLVMRAGAVSELQSVMFPIEVKLLANNNKIKRDKNGNSIYAAEMFVTTEYKKTSTDKQLKLTHLNKSISLALRGISHKTYNFRPNFKLVSGQKFTSGLREILVGRALARKIPELKVGKTITLGDTKWLISGMFSDNNSVFESELWADLGILQSDYNRGNTVQSVRLALKTTTNIDKIVAQLNKQWQDDPRLNVRIILEKAFFAEQGEKLNSLITLIGFPVAAIMALGAAIAALNTMYAAIASRSKEIATHKAIGFAPIAIASAIISEALFIAFLGGVLGVLPLYILFDDWTASTQNASNLSQMMFNFNISTTLIIQTMLLAIGIGLIGGLLPAIKAMKQPVTLALRDN